MSQFFAPRSYPYSHYSTSHRFSFRLAIISLCGKIQLASLWHVLTLYAICVPNAALIVYDYCITLAREVRCIWLRPWSVPTVIFIAIRYATVTVAILLWLLFGDPKFRGDVRTFVTAPFISLLILPQRRAFSIHDRDLQKLNRLCAVVRTISGLRRSSIAYFISP